MACGLCVIIVFIKRGQLEDRALDIQKVFEESGQGLNFMAELPHQNELQFLDIRLRFEEACTYWLYRPRSVKDPLSFSSGHSKMVKNGIVLSSIGAAILKSCAHAVAESAGRQLLKLNAAGYPSSVVAAACEN